MILKRLPSLVLFSTLLLLAVHCGSSNPPAETPPTTDTFTIGGSVSGLDGTLVLQNNGTDNLSITEDGDFTFDTEIEDGDGYEVTILTEPSGQTCSVTEDSGTATANVTDVEIVCEDKKIIFVTAATHNGDFDSGSGGAAGADAFCMGDANYPGSGTFKALIVEGGLGRTACSTADCSGGSSEHIDWIISANTTYYQDDETTEIGTTTSSGIFEFPVTNAFTTSIEEIWTGLLGDWTTDLTTCVGWTDGTGLEIGTYGDTTSNTANTISFTQSGCNDTKKIACVEQ